MRLIFHRRHAMWDLLTEAEKCSTNRILYLRGALLTDKLHGSANIWPTQILPSVGMVNRLTMLGVLSEADKMFGQPISRSLWDLAGKEASSGEMLLEADKSFRQSKFLPAAGPGCGDCSPNEVAMEAVLIL